MAKVGDCVEGRVKHGEDCSKQGSDKGKTVGGAVPGVMGGTGVGKAKVRGTWGSCSFRDKVLAGKKPVQIVSPGDFIEKKLSEVQFEEGGKRRPMIMFTPQADEVIAAPWGDALVIKLLGKNIGFSMMKQRLKPLWRLKGDFDIMNVGNGYYMAKFDLEEDRSKVIEGGPWMILDHYLAVKSWSLEFNPAEECFGKTMVWVRLADLNLSYYHEGALKAIAAGLGKLIKIDTTTQSVGRGRFARFCVEMDLSVPVHREIWIRDHWHIVEYESLHLICSKCDCYGHLSRSCCKEVVVADTPSLTMMAGDMQVEHMVQSDPREKPNEQERLREPRDKGGQQTDSLENLAKNSMGLNDEEGWVKVANNKNKSKHASSTKPATKKANSSGFHVHGMNAKHVQILKNKKVGVSNQAHTNRAKDANLSSKGDLSFTFGASKPHLPSLGGRSMHAQYKSVTPIFTAKKRQRPPSLVASPSLGEDEQQKPIIEGNMIVDFQISKESNNSSMEGTSTAT